MDTIRQMLRAVRAERSRILLVTLGVVWGTLGLTVLIASGSELDTAMHAAMRASGRDFLRISSGSTTMPFEGLPAGRFVPLTPDDADAVARAVPEQRAVSVEHASFGNSVEVGSRQLNALVIGVDASFGELRNYTPLRGGRFLNELDVAERRRVAFVGTDAARELFGDVEPVGRTIGIRGSPFTVVGVLSPRTPLGWYNGRDETKIAIPSSTFRDVFGQRRVSYLIAGLADPARDRQALDKIYRVLGERHRFDPADVAALDVNNHIAENRQTAAILAGTRVFLAIVGVCGLLVAAVGVANVMFVLVDERTREIGTLVALGATPRWIALGRIGEGLLITGVGGAVGIALAAAVLWGFNRIPMDATARAYLGEPQLSPTTGVAIVAVLGVAGTLAGLFPARRAARLDPVAALRDE